MNNSAKIKDWELAKEITMSPMSLYFTRTLKRAGGIFTQKLIQRRGIKRKNQIEEVESWAWDNAT